MILCSPLKVNQRFRGASCIHLQCQRLRQARNQGEEGRIAGFLLGLFSDLADGGDMFLQKNQFIFNGLHSIVSQKLDFFIATAVRAS
jgi:hypothetical protein